MSTNQPHRERVKHYHESGDFDVPHVLRLSPYEVC
jgi:hypothetical protein